MILSYNVRGLGGLAKKKGVQNLIVKHKPIAVCIQESKMEHVTLADCERLWGSNDCGFAFKPAAGRSGGLITIWDSHVLSVSNMYEGSHFLSVEGLWGKGKLEVLVINIYAPCEANKKKDLWDELLLFLGQQRVKRWCLAGDFNSIRNEQERGSDCSSQRHAEMKQFDDFIVDSEAIDLPLIGRRFTWYKAGGVSMSRIDRFLISNEWLSSWPESSQWGLDRELSDHCPILLKEVVKDWGPKPFKMLKCWRDIDGYNKMVKELW
jgi:exonuclease III